MPIAQTGTGLIGGSDIVGNINAEGKALANVIDWNPNQNLIFSSTATVDISRSILGSDNIFGDYTTLSQNLSLSNNSLTHYNIDMFKSYKYKVKFDYDTTDSEGNPAIVEKLFFVDSFRERISNCKAVYNYSTNSININWEHIKSKTNNKN